jgi:hypothetical protein
MAVHVGGRGDARVAQDPRHDCEFLSLLEPERGAGVPKVVVL